MWRQPALLDAPRKRIPNHLALLLVSDSSQPSEHAQDCMLQSVQRAVGWCQQVGIRKLTVYDQHGILMRCIPQIRERLASLVPTVESSDSEIEYPLTPPSSDYADSRPLSPRAVYPHVFSMQLPRCTRNPTQRRKKVKRRRSRAHAGNVALAPLTLCISSRDSAKPAVATAACSLLQAGKSDQLFNPQQPTSPPVSVDTLNVLLECDSGLSSPDFLILHSITPPYSSKTPLELYGFPPWHIRLTEIYQCRHPPTRYSKLGFSTLEEINFREALDEYAMAEFRFGK